MHPGFYFRELLFDIYFELFTSKGDFYNVYNVYLALL